MDTRSVGQDMASGAAGSWQLVRLQRQVKALPILWQKGQALRGARCRDVQQKNDECDTTDRTVLLLTLTGK